MTVSDSDRAGPPPGAAWYPSTWPWVTTSCAPRREQCIALITPRPLLVINSDSDNHTPLAGVEVCVDAARKIYSAENVDEKFSVIIQKNTGHKVLPDSEHAAIEWFARWLQP